MKTSPFLLLLSFVLVSSVSVHAQTEFQAWQLGQPAKGNHEIKDYGVLNDFQVVSPITITALGAFDSDGDGFNGAGGVTVQLFQRARKPHLLLETVTFDAAHPGELVGGFRYRQLAQPLTLLPGTYILTARGFNEQNQNYNFTLPPQEGATVPVLTLNDGGGLVRFLGCNRFTVEYGLPKPMIRNPPVAAEPPENVGPANRFAAASFRYSAAASYPSPFAADYAALTAGVSSFPSMEGPSSDPERIYGTKNVLNRYGSIALMDVNAFPIIVEPAGNRLIFEAAGIYQGNPNGARCVAFAHEQFGHVPGDERMVLFENAIKWASRKSNPADIVMGLSTNFDAGYFLSRGYQVRPLDRNMKTNDLNPMPGCDVIVVDFHGPYTERFMTRATEFVANGGGLVATFLPWRYVHAVEKPMFGRVNKSIEPFGLTYRSSLTRPRDFGFTNLLAAPYPPVLFNAYPAAQLLRESRKNEIQLSSLEKAIAMNTIAYAADRRPDRLSALTAIYAGSPTDSSSSVPSEVAGNFVDVVTLRASQAGLTSESSVWKADGDALVAQDRRGSVEYTFNVPAPDIYRLRIVGFQNLPASPHDGFDLAVTVDGVRLGRHRLQAELGVVEVLTPFLNAGDHSLGLLWDNGDSRTQLRLQSIHVQSAYGTDDDEDGVKDWVESLVGTQSGLDNTNEVIASYVSPLCLEGRDPYPALMTASVSGADDSEATPKPRPAPDGRWFLNVPLASTRDAALQVSYQNGAKAEIRALRWLPINVLNGGSFTIRKRDKLLLVARPDTPVRGTFSLTVGTNQLPVRQQTSPLPYRFTEPGTYTVMATATNGTIVSTGSIQVTVVEHQFSGEPACWVEEGREWDVSLPAEAVLESDSRLLLTEIAPLENGGWRTSLLTDQSEPRQVISRLGANGPILDSVAVRGFNFWWARDTYLKVVETYPDDSQLVEMLLVLSPVLSGVTVRLDVSVGGVLFDDGTTSRELTAADFNAQGACRVRFIRPAAAKTSVCHSIRLFQSGTQIGYIQ